MPTDEPTSKLLALAVRVKRNVRKLVAEKEELATEKEELIQLTEFV